MDTIPEHTTAPAPTPAPYAQPQYAQQIVVNLPPTSGWAVTGFVFSLLGLPFVGLILSLIALDKTKDPNISRGRGLAVAGVAVGAVATVVFFFLWMGAIASLMGFNYLWFQGYHESLH